MALDVFGPTSLFAEGVTVFREYLVTSGFIWIIWLVVALFTILFIREIVEERKKLHESLPLFIYPFIVGLLSWIAVGNAIVMALPIVIGVAAWRYVPKAINKAIEKGAARRAQVAERKKELGEEKREESEERMKEMEARRELTIFKKKFYYTQELMHNLQYGSAAIPQLMLAVGEITTQQQKLLRRMAKGLIKLKKQERKKYKGEKKWDLIERRLDKGVSKMEQKATAKNIRFEEYLEKEVAEEKRNVFRAWKDSKILRGILREELRLLGEIPKATIPNRRIGLAQEFYRLCINEEKWWIYLMKTIHFTETLEKQEEGLTSKLIGLEERELFSEKNMYLAISRVGRRFR